MITFTILGSPRFLTQPKAEHDIKEEIRQGAMAAATGKRLCIDGAVWIDITLNIAQPKGMKQHDPTHATHNPRVDEAATVILDALTELVFEDKSQVAVLSCLKRWCPFGEKESTVVRIAPLKEVR